MNRRTLAFFLSATLCAALGAAQTGGTGTTGTGTPSTTMGMSSTAAGDTFTISGTVVSSGFGQLVLDTDAGRRTFEVDEESNLPANLQPGSRVDLRYHDMGAGRFHVADASIVDMPVTGTGTVVAGTAGTTTDFDEDTTTTTTTTATTTTRTLPATASPLPLVGLAGALALAGGAALRFVREHLE